MRTLETCMSFFALSFILSACLFTSRVDASGLIVHKNEDFLNGATENVYINNGNELALMDSRVSGYYESPIVTAEKFKSLVASWSASTDSQCSVTMLVRIQADDKWSSWFSYGKFSNGGKRASIGGQADSIANMNIDTIVTKKSSATAFQYKIYINRDSAAVKSPTVKQASFALTLVDLSSSYPAELENAYVNLPVPPRSQMSVPKIGGVICSPTSLSMLLEYNGVKEDTAAVAARVYDMGAKIYGNWSYNVAYAGEKGLDAYVEKGANINDIKKYLDKGIPVAISIKSKKKSDLIGAPSSYPDGHLIVVRGYTVVDSVPYLIVNDPAEKDVSKVIKHYREDQIMNVWSKIMYVVKSADNNNSSLYAL